MTAARHDGGVVVVFADLASQRRVHGFENWESGGVPIARVGYIDYLLVVYR